MFEWRTSWRNLKNYYWTIPYLMYLSLRLTTKVRACKVAGGKWSPRVTFYTFGNVGKCEGMNSHALKWAPTSGVKVSMDSWIFIEQLQGSRLIGLKSSLYHWKSLKTYMFKMGLYNPFGYLKHKLWPKEGLGIKLPISLPITKSQKSPYLLVHMWHSTYCWKDLNKGYNFALNLTSIEGLRKKL
jgi:hypothetical protein